MPKLTEHFSLPELACHCGCKGHLAPGVLDNLHRLAAMLETVRHAFGDKAITVNCAFRCKAHNKEVGGAPQSLHMSGKAADITIAGLTPAKVQETAPAVPGVGGVGHYDAFTHLDTGPRRSWEG